jgi:hypothetical protein
MLFYGPPTSLIPGTISQFNRYAEGHGKIITGKKTFLAHLAKKIFHHN